MSRKANYLRMINIWECRYGIKLRREIVAYKPTCEKCKKNKAIHRHHKGHEFILACYDEVNWAKRYLEFRVEDIIWLCEKCHKNCHKVYDKFVEQFYTEVLFTANKKVTCEKYHKIFTEAYEKWVKNKKTSVRIIMEQS